jgi:arylformamidase
MTCSRFATACCRRNSRFRKRRRADGIRHRLRPGTSVAIAVGSDETAPFLDQAESYRKHLAVEGIESRRVILPHENHMTVERSLGEAGTAASRLLGETIAKS